MKHDNETYAPTTVILRNEKFKRHATDGVRNETDLVLRKVHSGSYPLKEEAESKKKARCSDTETSDFVGNLLDRLDHQEGLKTTRITNESK